MTMQHVAIPKGETALLNSALCPLFVMEQGLYIDCIHNHKQAAAIIGGGSGGGHQGHMPPL